MCYFLLAQASITKDDPYADALQKIRDEHPRWGQQRLQNELLCGIMLGKIKPQIPEKCPVCMRQFGMLLGTCRLIARWLKLQPSIRPSSVVCILAHALFRTYSRQYTGTFCKSVWRATRASGRICIGSSIPFTNSWTHFWYAFYLFCNAPIYVANCRYD